MKFNLMLKPGEELISRFEAVTVDIDSENDSDYEDDENYDDDNEHGIFCITNQRIVFRTETKTTTIKLSNIATIDHDDETITISPENGKSLRFDTWKTLPESVADYISAVINEIDLPELLPNEFRIQQIEYQRQQNELSLQMLRQQVNYTNQQAESKNKSVLGFMKKWF